MVFTLHYTSTKDNIAGHNKDVTMSTTQIMGNEVRLYCNTPPRGTDCMGTMLGFADMGVERPLMHDDRGNAPKFDAE